jgi:hypothetical protein
MADTSLNRRREPRVRIRTYVTVSGCSANGDLFTAHTKTLDVSPHGASVTLGVPMRVGATVDFRNDDGGFSTRAAVRCVKRDPTTGLSAVGLEYLGEATNPIVPWASSATGKG